MDTYTRAWQMVQYEIEAAKAKHGDSYVEYLPLRASGDRHFLKLLKAAGNAARLEIEVAGTPTQCSVLIEEVGEFAETMLEPEGVPLTAVGEIAQVAAMSIVILAQFLEGEEGEADTDGGPL